jgi:alginate O-acetyltransferase complex protein AlgI
VVFLFAFLPVTFVLYVLCRNDTLRNVLLAAASLVFYAVGEPVAVFIMVVSIVLNYFLGRAAAGDRFDKLAVGAATVLNLGLLVVFKYLGFFTSLVNSVTPLSLPVPQISLPIGISFFTFQGLSYVIDVYRDKSSVQKNFLLVLLYISFFPQLIAGPIVKYHDIEGQLKKRELSLDRVSRGVCRFIVGLGKKVLISNQMGLVADSVFGADCGSLGVFSAWAGAVAYMLQIFFDFSGYSDMAIGLGCIFGFDFKENFNYPFISSSMREFWRRWHISLSTWFKEYVYIPLGGNRRGKARANLNRSIVFLLTGLWHGANLTFIVWGILHGAFLLFESGLSGIVPQRVAEKKWLSPIKHVYALMVILLTFVIFRADTLSQGFGVISAMFGGGTADTQVCAEIMSQMSALFAVALVFAVLFSTPIAPMIKAKLGRYSVLEHVGYFGTLCIFALCILSLVSSEYNPFIYFRF